jgi:hypothetical protein
MKKLTKILVLFLAILLIPCLLYAGKSGGGGNSGAKGNAGKTVHVPRYDRKDGTVVKDHYRAPPSQGSGGAGIGSPGNNSDPDFKSNNTPDFPKFEPEKHTLGVKRSQDGKIIRSEEAKREYLKSIGKDSLPEGYQIDHKVPLYAGGCDCPENMQLLTTQEHKIKTKNDYMNYSR